MNLTDKQRRVIEQVVNVFETGSPEGDYANITVYEDGPGDTAQITYGRSQTTEFGKLRELVRMYVEAHAAFSDALCPYVDRIGTQPLSDDETFKELLRQAGREDPVMRSTQDLFFAERYFEPAMQWATEQGFILGLSGLIIYDSFIHSGGVLWDLRERFPEKTPSEGGKEAAWIMSYVKARHAWLSGHRRKILRRTTYRTRCFLDQIDRGNWNLDLLPLLANGVPVSGD
jgi:chitosanase